MNIQRILKGQDTLPFKYLDKGAMATVGKKKAVVNMPNFSIYGFLAWFVRLVVHLLYLVGFGNWVGPVFHWTRNYFDSDRGFRLILNTGNSKKEKRRRKRKFFEEHRQKQEERESAS